LATYRRRTVPVAALVVLGAVVVAFATWGQWRDPQNMAVSLAILAVLAGVILAAGLVLGRFSTSHVDLRAAEIVFVTGSRGRHAIELESLRAIAGRTKTQAGFPGVAPARTHRVYFLTTLEGHRERSVMVNGPSDAEIARFVEQIERLKPGVDTSAFWAWSMVGRLPIPE
jgi:hypothetical protein